MRVKLIREIEGNHGTYPADTWLDAIEMDGFIFVRYAGHPGMAGKRVARSNIKEVEQEKVLVPDVEIVDTKLEVSVTPPLKDQIVS